jgi:hypothetical protein
MPVEPRPAGSRRGAPAASSRLQFHLRLPDVFAEQKRTAPQAIAARPPGPAPGYDAIAAARAKLSEKRFLDGHKQVTSMIDHLRHRRQRLFRRLWAASVLLTALSVVALAVELVQRMDVLNPIGDAVLTEDQNSSAPARSRRETTPARKPAAKSGAPREWSNQLPEDNSVQSAIYETAGPNDRAAAWLTSLTS